MPDAPMAPGYLRPASIIRVYRSRSTRFSLAVFARYSFVFYHNLLLGDKRPPLML